VGAASRSSPCTPRKLMPASGVAWQEQSFGVEARVWDQHVSAKASRSSFGSDCEHGTSDGYWPGKAGQGLPVCACGASWYRKRLRSQGKQLKALGIPYWMWPKERELAAELVEAAQGGEAAEWLLAHRSGLETTGEHDVPETAGVEVDAVTEGETEGETEGNVEADPDGGHWPEVRLLARDFDESGNFIVGGGAAWQELYALPFPP